MSDPKTVEEFESQYAARSGITVEELHDLGRYGASCDCDWGDCPGWQMKHRGYDDSRPDAVVSR